MNADLERLIALQKLDSKTHDAERTLAAEPAKLQALESKLEALRQAVTTAKALLTENQTARRALEKDVAMHQGRLSKFREQAMAVKTNQEYHAIQHEMSFAQTEIKKLEDSELELMMSADDMTAAAKKAEAELTAAQKEGEVEKKALAEENGRLKTLLDTLRGERTGVVSGLTPSALAVFELVSKRRNGVAMAEAREGICTICHVRLRPQVFNTVLRNEAITQCDSCQRILYHVPPQPLAIGSHTYTR